MRNRTGATVAATTQGPHLLDFANLTPEQRDGLACVHCGATGSPMTPVAILNGVQLFACTAHDGGQCPAWCITSHTGGETEHAGALGSLTLSREPYPADDPPVELMTALYQEPGDEPHIGLSINDHQGTTLTLAEAEQLACELLTLIMTARGPAAGSR